ncbi:hypothetical protein [Erythrobacter sp.]|uniref:hypothetical protein n=1 Tax=Erythrobacter sp. TaxID=1042 RepID=UPI002EA031AF|nr:hypothetical protein [Erythrobacter sp.]
MSYRIAFVRFNKGGQTYPVNCDRSDFGGGEIVVVRMGGHDRLLKIAEIDRVEFLNWRCKNSIICKRSEWQADGVGSYSIKRETPPRTIETIDGLEFELSKIGWVRTRLSSHVYRSVFVRTFDARGAAIGIRRNGIDFQIYDASFEGSLQDRLQRFPDGSRNLVRHNFYASEIDLLEYTKKFALCANRPVDELQNFFKPIGRKQPPPSRERNELHDIAEAIGDAMTDTERDAFGSW